MAGRFINDDVKIRQGGRKAPRISQTDLRDIIIRTAKRLNNDEFEYQVKSLRCAGNINEELYIAATIVVENDTTIEADNKFNFEWSNFYINCQINKQDPENMCGLHTLNNGFTFLGFSTAGDEQMPAFGILYYDGKRIRLYFPSYGNYVNLDFNCALGSECDYTKEERVEKKYRKLGIWDENNEDLFEFDSPCWDALYCAKYGLDVYESFNWDNINWDALIQDIESRIEII